VVSVMFAGIKEMARGTSEFVFESIKSQLERDGISLKDVSQACFDTCSVNFGHKSGVVSRGRRFAPLCCPPLI
jgi:hypothetical protein